MKTQTKNPDCFWTDIKMYKNGTMSQEDEGTIWEILDLLTKAEYEVGKIGANIKNERIFSNFDKARKKIRDAAILLTPLQEL